MTPVIHLTMPKSWQELDDQQLYYVYGLIADNLSGAQIRTYCLFRWGKLSVVCQYGDGYLIKQGKNEFFTTVEIITDAIRSLKWIEEISDKPVRISVVKNQEAVDAMLNGVPFEDYLYLENLYQGFLNTTRHDLINEMGQRLYGSDKLTFGQAEKLNVFYWWTSLKTYFSKQFPNFFVPASTPTDGNLLGNTKPIGQQLQEAMNAQIRALTKGDITKEKEVLAMDTWRALTELDALAKEAEEFNRKYGKH